MKTKEQWIDDTMESMEGITRAAGNPLLYDKVMSRLTNPRSGVISFTPRILWQIAAGIALLISINIFSVVYFSKSSVASKTQINKLASEYFSYIETIKL